MKIEIHNLGPVHRFDLDLEKDLHLLYGENNVGKSFVVNVVYCLLKVLLDEKTSFLEMWSANGENNGTVDGYFEKKAKTCWETVVVGTLNKHLENTYETLAPLVQKPGSAGSFLKIRIPGSHTAVLSITKQNKGFRLEKLEMDPNWKAVVPKEKKPRPLLANLPGFDHFNVYFLPASRSGLYPPLSGMGEIITELSQHRTALKSRFDLPSLSKPVSDYYLNLVGAGGETTAPELRRIGDTIEKQIVKGKIILNPENKKIYYHPNGTKNHIPITQAASMVAELAPLVLYLNKVVSIGHKHSKSILFVEEPEAHLHPKVQVQIMEIFAELAKRDVKVILTSHSDFMFNKLSNMLLAKELVPEKVAVYHLVSTERGSAVVADMQATLEGIEDHNFVTVSEELYNERLNIYHQLNESQDAAR